jgi:tRNA 2-thiouridine synthesizing protein A
MKTYIDSLGEMCPVPVIKAMKAYAGMSVGDEMIIVTDHSCVSQSIVEHFCRFRCKVTVDEALNGVWEIYIKAL